MLNMFTYGTLEIPEVMEAVTGRTFRSVDAIAQGFARYVMKNRVYPGLISESDAQTPGRVYLDIDETTLDVLDRFEDKVYVRQPITVHTREENWIEAYAYVIYGLPRLRKRNTSLKGDRVLSYIRLRDRTIRVLSHNGCRV